MKTRSRPARTRSVPVAAMILAALAALVVAGLSSQLFPQADEADAASIAAPLSTAVVVRRMVAMNVGRHAALHSFTALRHYHLEYQGLGTDIADMEVRVDYTAPGPKRLTIVSESGSGMLLHHVLGPLIRTEEKEAEIESTEGSVFVPNNYSFTMVDYPHPGGQPDYVLAIKPRRDAHRFLFRGTIWIDPDDFGLVRAEGTSVHAPSWLVSKFEFSYHGQKIGDFWMPQSNDCVSHLRLFGHATLDVTYKDFEITPPHPVSFLAGETPQ